MSKEKIILRFDIPCSLFDIQTAKSEERQEHLSAFNRALATECETPGMLNKKKLFRLLNGWPQKQYEAILNPWLTGLWK